MISIPGSLSFAKLVMMSSAPAKSAGMPETRPKIHSSNQRYPIQSRLQSVFGVRSSNVERNKAKNDNFELKFIAFPSYENVKVTFKSPLIKKGLRNSA